MSSTSDGDLAELQQTIVDLQRQLAEARQRLDESTAERDAALARETAAGEVLQVINSSPGDLAPVFDTMLDKALHLCEASYGALQTFDGDFFSMVAHRTPGDQRYQDVIAQMGPFRPERGSTVDRLVRGESVVQILDLSADEQYKGDGPIRRALVEIAGARTFLSIALKKDEMLVGALHVYRKQVRPFSDKQIALLQNFAAQAVIAMENARLLTETREALEQQTATAEVLQVINSSPGDLAPVFDAILEKAHNLCGVTIGALEVWDGQRLRALATRGLPPEFEELIRDHQAPFVERLLQDGFVHNIDVAEFDEPLARASVELAGVRTTLHVALRKDGMLLGQIVAARREVRPFSEKQIALLQNFAAQAVVAMENARLLGELRERTNDLEESLEYQTATSNVLQVISRSTFDLQPVLDTMIETAARLCAADSGNVLKREGEVYLWVSGFGLLPEYQKLMAVRVREGYALGINRRSIVGRVTLEGGVVHLHDAASDPEYSQEIARLGAIRTVLGVPLLRERLPIGAIMLWRHRVEPFTERQIELVRTFADQAVIAMENARLLGELRQRTDEVAELNRGLEARVAEQVEELGRVGRLKRFLAPQLAELIVSQGDEKILESHRREIVVVFCDLRGYTAFTETAEPEEVLKFLREYHGALGPLVSQYEGTLDQFSGDGIMVFFNDPVPCPDPAERAVKMAMAMREAAGQLIAAWRLHGCELGFGAGIAQGYATLGQIGFSERSGYTAIGTVCNLAARLCAEAKDGQILVSSHIAEAVKAVVRLEKLGNLELKGLRRPVAAFNVAQSTSAADARPNLTVVASGPEA